jgi:putative flavoprotein involved in K+ transport
MERVLRTIDGYLACRGGEDAGPADPPPPFTPPAGPLELDLRRAGISTVIWATGYQPAYPWLRVPVLDRHGQIAHSRGVTSVPGLYVVGLKFQYRRNSSFIDGVASDARFVAAHVMMRRMTARAVAAADHDARELSA